MSTKIILVAAICSIFLFPLGHGISSRYKVDITKHPYQVSIEMYKMFHCSGVIVHPEWVLTAAQCIHNVDQSSMRIRGGTVYRGIFGEVHDIEKIVKHPDFKPNTLEYDFGLIKLTEPFNITNETDIIYFAKKIPIDGTLVTLTGWGSPSQGTWLESELHKSYIPLVYWMDCMYNYERVTRSITGDMICAGQEGNSACGGDVGDPLTYNNQLIGIMSWSYGCGEKHFPAVFSAVYKFANWVNTIIA